MGRRQFSAIFGDGQYTICRSLPSGSGAIPVASIKAAAGLDDRLINRMTAGPELIAACRTLFEIGELGWIERREMSDDQRAALAKVEEIINDPKV